MLDERVVVVGMPLSGKGPYAEQLAAEMGVPLWHTDRLQDLGWSEASEAASHWFDEDGPWVIAGMAVPRALRKWKLRNPGNGRLPYTRAVEFWERKNPEKQLTEGQQRMGEAAKAVWDEVQMMAKNDPRDSRGRLWLNIVATNTTEIFVGQEPGIPARFAPGAWDRGDGKVRLDGPDNILVPLTDGHDIQKPVGRFVELSPRDGLSGRAFISSAAGRSSEWQQLAMDGIAAVSVEGRLNEGDWQDEGYLLITNATLWSVAMLGVPAMKGSSVQVVPATAIAAAAGVGAPAAPEESERELPVALDMGPLFRSMARASVAFSTARLEAAVGGMGGGK